MYHLERRVGEAEASDAKRAFLAKYSKAMKCKGMEEQKNTKTKISAFRNAVRSEFWFETMLVGSGML